MQATRLQWNSEESLINSYLLQLPPWPPVQLPKYFLHSTNLFYDLVEWVGSRAPVGEEHAEANCLEQARNDTDSNLVDWTLLGDDL